MEFHNCELKKVCRVCGRRLKKAKKERERSYECKKFIRELSEVFRIDVSSDCEDIHPLLFCLSCFTIITKWQGGNVPPAGRIFQWERHEDSDCRICQHFTSLRVGGASSKGGRPKSGRPKVNTPAEIVTRMASLAPEPFFPGITDLPIPVNNDILCPICYNILEQPLELECGGAICLLCCTSWIQICDSVQCPCCYNSLESHVKSPSRLTLGVIGQQLVECSRGCNRTIKVELYHKHLQSQCQSHYEHSTYSPSRTIIQEILNKQGDAPTSSIERKVAQNLFKRMMAESEDSHILTVPTQGQPVNLMTVSKCRVKTSEASDKTITRRTRNISQMRTYISGGDASVQMSSELQALCKTDREELLREASLPVQIPPDHALALKADLALPWSKMRVISRWLKTLSISVASERKQRSLAKTIVGENMVAEMGAFTKRLEGGGEEICEVPFVYVPNLIAKASDLVEKHRQTQAGLTWHKVIPEHEIWLKLGGDKGHGSFKLNLQLCNVDHPNSQKNTCLLSMYMAGDSTTNLHTCMNMYREQVSELQGMSLRDYTFRVFLAGDYEFLSRIYGLSGASGRHCCLWCSISNANLKVPLLERGRSPERTLTTLKDDYANFLQQSGGDIRRAKFHNNVISPVIVEIPLDQVCIPGLHISLGIYNKLWKLLEVACNELDSMLAQHTSEEVGGQTFAEYAAAFRKKESLANEVSGAERRATILEQLATYVALQPSGISQLVPSLSILRQEASKARMNVITLTKEMDDLEASIGKGFKPSDGPYFQSLSQTLTSLNVERQAYQGGTFVGNHVNKLLRPASIHSLLSGVMNASTNSNMVPPAQAVFDKFSRVFLLFGKCHDIYNSNIVDDSTIAQLELNIQEFLTFYRSNFPSSTVIPKMHLLEDHTVPWLRRWHLGAGLMGEQGAEAIHAHVNKLESNYSGITNRLERLKYIFNEYMLETAPFLQNLRPPLKKRKTN